MEQRQDAEQENKDNHIRKRKEKREILDVVLSASLLSMVPFVSFFSSIIIGSLLKRYKSMISAMLLFYLFCIMEKITFSFINEYIIFGLYVPRKMDFSNIKAFLVLNFIWIFLWSHIAYGLAAFIRPTKASFSIQDSNS